MNPSALRTLLLSLAFAAILAAASCQSTGPTGNAMARTEPSKTAEDLRKETSGPSELSELVGRFGKEMTFRQCRLTIPKDAFSEDIFITIAFPDGAPDGFIPETAYALAPDKLDLAKPALLAIHYFDDDIKEGESEQDIQLMKLMEGVWMPAGDFSLDVYNNIVSTTITRLEIYSLMVVPRRTPMINQPPVAKIAFEILPLEETAAEKEAKAAASGEAGEAAGEKAAEGESATPPADAGEATPPVPPEGSVQAPDELPLAPANGGQPKVLPPEKPGEGAAAVPPANGKDAKEGAAPAGKEVEPEDTKQAKRDTYVLKTPAAPVKPEAVLGARVRYTGGESTDPDGKITRYSWDSNADGVIDKVSSAPDYIQRYETYGAIMAVLQVEDNQRPAESDMAFAVLDLPKDKLAPKLPFAVSAVAFPAEAPKGGHVVMGAQVTGGEQPYKYSWSFSDGTTGDEQAVMLVALRTGELRGELTVTDASGRSLGKTVSATVIPERKQAEAAPTMLVRPGRVYLDLPGKVTFTAQVDGARTPYTMLIDPGFGQPFTTQQDTFSVTFANAGYYVLTATLTDHAGRSAKYFVPVQVTGGEKGVSGAPAYAQPAFGLDYDKNGGITFTAAGVGRSRLQWDFGDGTSSDAAKPQKRYAKPGEYLVTLTADDGFRQQTVQRNIAYGGGKLVAAIDAPATMHVMAPYRLSAHAVVADGRMPLFYKWKLGEKYSEEEFPEFALGAPGTYQLQLTVGDADGSTYETDPVIIEVSRTPKQYRYPIAYFQNRENGGIDVKLAEFDGSSEYNFTLGPDAPVGVSLAPQGTGIALLDGTGFVVFDLAGGRKVLDFTPSGGAVSGVFLTSSPELIAFNVNGSSEVRGYIRSEASGVLPVSDRGERILAVTPDGSALLLTSSEGSRVMNIDAFTGGLSSPAPVGGPAQLGALSADGSRAFMLAADNDVYAVNIAEGSRSRLTTDGKSKTVLSVGNNGSTVAYGTSEGSIFVIRPQGDIPGMPVNVSQLAGLSSQNWRMADGKLILAYSALGDKQGLYMLNIDTDLSAATSSTLELTFFAECTGVFTMSGDKRYFDVLLRPEGGLRQEEVKAP